jgi:hypothetical protein
MQQANPDAGDPHSSDSDGKGVWVTDGDRIKGKWVEVIADRASHKFTGRAEISYDIKVRADTFAGTITASSYDAAGALTESPTSPTPLEGRRVTLPCGVSFMDYDLGFIDLGENLQPLRSDAVWLVAGDGFEPPTFGL